MAQETPKLFLDPNEGPPEASFTATFEWPACGGVPAGPYRVELYWDASGNLLAESPEFAYSGAGDCQVPIDAAVPPDAAPGLHDVIASMVDSSGQSQPFGEVKAEFVVVEKETPGPDATRRTPRPRRSRAPDATASPEVTPPGPIASLPADDRPDTIANADVVPIAEYVPHDDSLLGSLARAVASAPQLAPDLALGGVSTLVVAMSRGINVFAAGSGPNLSGSPEEAIDPDVAATATDVYVVWSDSYEGNWDVYFARSTDHGYTFRPPVNLSNNAGASEHPRVVAEGSRVTVAWDDDSAGPRAIFTVVSTDGGATWGAPASAGLGSNPVMAAGGGRAYVAWIAPDVFRTPHVFFHQVGSGTSRQLTESGGGEARNPAIAASGSNVAISWESNPVGDWDVNFMRSADGGGSWESNLFRNARGWMVPTWSDYGDDVNPAIAMSGSNVFVVYEGNRYAHRYVVHRGSSDAGLSLTADVRTAGFQVPMRFNYEFAGVDNVYDVNDSTYTDPMYASVAANGDAWCVAYLAAARRPNGSSDSTLFSYCADRPGFGVSVGAQRDIDRPIALFAGDRNAVVWPQRTSSAAPFDVFIRTGSGQRNLSANSGDSTGPRAASSGANVTVVWTDTTNGSRQVYYATVPAR